LIELLVTMAVVILASVAVPNFSRFIDSSRQRADIQQVVRSLVAARSEAIVRASPLILTATAGDWTKGWRIWVDLNASDSYDDGENFKVAEAIKTSAIISAKLDGAAVTNITFDNQGFIHGAKLVLISYRSQPEKCSHDRDLNITLSGQVAIVDRVCSP
jgi:type IV fimbrial biogenesis protein FimT